MNSLSSTNEARGESSARPDAERPVIASDPADREQLSDSDFKAQLTAIVPHLRAFGRSLSGNRDLADDLVQETLLKAWAARKRFQAGTNMRAWTFIILRNHYLSQVRRNRFRGEWDDLTADRILAAPASQDRHIDLSDLQRALQQLPQPQREALILVGAGGFAYEGFSCQSVDL
jgi:RNA polymerase sigma-70 factor (ECF subfamily)